MAEWTLHSEEDQEFGEWTWWAESDAHQGAAAAGDDLEECKTLVREMCEMERWPDPTFVLADQPNHYIAGYAADDE